MGSYDMTLFCILYEDRLGAVFLFLYFPMIFSLVSHSIVFCLFVFVGYALKSYHFFRWWHKMYCGLLFFITFMVNIAVCKTKVLVSCIVCNVCCVLCESWIHGKRSRDFAIVNLASF